MKAYNISLTCTIVFLLLSSCIVPPPSLHLNCPTTIRIGQSGYIEVYVQHYIGSRPSDRTYLSPGEYNLSIEEGAEAGTLTSEGINYIFDGNTAGSVTLKASYNEQRDLSPLMDKCSITVADDLVPIVSLEFDGSIFTATVEGGTLPYLWQFEITRCKPTCITTLLAWTQVTATIAEASYIEEEGDSETSLGIDVIVTDSEGYQSKDSLSFSPDSESVISDDLNVEIGSVFCQEGTGNMVIRFNSVAPLLEQASQFFAVIDEYVYTCSGDGGFPNSLFCSGPARKAGTTQPVELVSIDSGQVVYSSDQTLPTCLYQGQNPDGQGDCKRVYDPQKHAYVCK